MKVLKFGGKALEKGVALNNAIDIIKQEQKKSPIAVVVSAISNTTDLLIDCYHLALKGKNYARTFDLLIANNQTSTPSAKTNSLLKEVETKLKQLSIEKKGSKLRYDEVLAYGELLSIHRMVLELKQNEIQAKPIDSRKFIKFKQQSETLDVEQSKMLCQLYFEHFNFEFIPIISGFIASDQNGATKTLGRNGSNYSASLLSNFLDAAELQNWTTVDGIYTAKPEWVPNAQLISKMSFREAHELANFGTNILHPRTIEPLQEKNISLHIRNTLNLTCKGTKINHKGGEKGIKAVSVVKEVSLISFKGNGLGGKVGIDGRIFKILGMHGINIRLIAQASSERGIGFIVDQEEGEKAVHLLQTEFKKEIENNEVSSIQLNTEVAIIAIIGRHNFSLEKAISGLRRNKIWMHLINNSISGNQISLVVDNVNLSKSIKVVHGQVFGAIRTIHLFCFGKGVVCSRLINQIVKTNKQLIRDRQLDIKIVGIADSKKFILTPEGLDNNWQNVLAKSLKPSNPLRIIEKLKASQLENIVIADNTASEEIADHYAAFINAGFDLVASNKKLNAGKYSCYKKVQELLRKKGRRFYYETNVGAGSPIIDTLKHLRDSADKISRIKGVFSGSLSYLFNNFSESNQTFSEILLQAKEQGLTEADPREDLSGMDVARKLIILAREINIAVDIEGVCVENLIPENLINNSNFQTFMKQKEQLDQHYNDLKSTLSSEEVLRYVGDLNVEEESLSVSLIKVKRGTPLGSIKGADSVFELYTEGYGEQPIVIQGAGAGGEVTARGVYSDLIRLGKEY